MEELNMARCLDNAKVNQVKQIQSNLKMNGYASSYAELYVDDILCTAKVKCFLKHTKEVKKALAKKGFDVIDTENHQLFDKFDIIVDVSKKALSIEDCIDI